MRVKLPLVMCNDQGDEETVTDVITLNKHHQRIEHLGLTLAESTHLLSTLQQPLLQQQVNTFLDTCSDGPDCGTPLHLKARSRRSFRTLFGTVQFDNPRLEQCDCTRRKTASFRPPVDAADRVGRPGAVVYGSQVVLSRQDFLPLDRTLDVKTVRYDTLKVAKRLEAELGDEQASCIEGDASAWDLLPLPEGAFKVGIDGGYVRHGVDKKRNFEVIVGKRTLSVGEGEETEILWHKRCGFVQTYDDAKSKRRLHEVLHAQGLQMNQAMTFLSDGNDILRALQVAMSPKATHILDWFHLTMKLTVLGQYGKGLVQCEAELGKQICDQIERLKWSLWHPQVDKVLAKINDLQTSVAQFIRVCRWLKLVYT